MKDNIFMWGIISLLAVVLGVVYYCLYSLIVYGLTLLGATIAGMLWPLVILLTLFWLFGLLQIILIVYSFFRNA